MSVHVVLGGGGFIGGHMAKHLKGQGHTVLVADQKLHEWWESEEICDHFSVCDLRDKDSVRGALTHFDDVSYVWQFAADMGGAGFVFVGDNDADIMHNSAQINLNVLDVISSMDKMPRVLYTSSACIYPEHNQMDPENPNCKEDSAYPADPDSEYGWEKLFSERLYFSYMRNKGVDVRVVRLHNIFGPQGTWRGGREKAPAAMCRKWAEAARDSSSVEIWGDGEQTRSFLYIDECIEGLLRFMDNEEFFGPVNLGSDEMVTINGLVDIIDEINGTKMPRHYIDGPQGVRGRNSDNDLIKERLGWAPSWPLRRGVERTFEWIVEQLSEGSHEEQ